MTPQGFELRVHPVNPTQGLMTGWLAGELFRDGQPVREFTNNGSRSHRPVFLGRTMSEVQGRANRYAEKNSA